MSALSVRLPESLHEKVRELAAQDNVSINQFITLALAEKIAAMTTAEYLIQRAQRANRDAFDTALSKIPDVDPDDRDQL